MITSRLSPVYLRHKVRARLSSVIGSQCRLNALLLEVKVLVVGRTCVCYAYLKLLRLPQV